MSWSSRRAILLMPLALAACGFSPTLAPGSAAAALRGRIRVADPVDKNGYDFLREMELRLGRPGVPLYDLTYTITTTTVGVGLTPEGVTQRYNLEGKVVWQLIRRSDNTRVTGGQVQSFTAYLATGSTVAELAAQQDAGVRLMRILADRVVMILQSTAASWST